MKTKTEQNNEKHDDEQKQEELTTTVQKLMALSAAGDREAMKKLLIERWAKMPKKKT